MLTDLTENTHKTTIMFTDIVGYGSLVGKNESKAMKMLKEHDGLIVPIITENNGKIIKHIGDSIFAFFDNAKDAVSSALIFQKEISDRNEITGAVNVSDIVLLINAILDGNVNEHDYACQADLTGDGWINVSDIVFMVNMILNF